MPSIRNDHHLPTLSGSLLLVLLVLLIAGCGSRAGHGPLGFIIDVDGSSHSTRNLDNVRRVHGNYIARRLAEDQPGWAFEAEIQERPVWIWDVEEGEWSYPQATVSVAARPGADAPALDQARAEAVVRAFFAELSEPEQVAVTVTQSDAPPSTPPPVTASQPATPADPTSGSGTTYVIQAGDTLADISAAFYGTAQHWRTIVTANPGLDPTRLETGRSITIPELTTD